MDYVSSLIWLVFIMNSVSIYYYQVFIRNKPPDKINNIGFRAILASTVIITTGTVIYLFIKLELFKLSLMQFLTIHLIITILFVFALIYHYNKFIKNKFYDATTSYIFIFISATNILNLIVFGYVFFLFFIG